MSLSARPQPDTSRSNGLKRLARHLTAEVIAELEEAVGPAWLSTDADAIGQKTLNSVGLSSRVLGVIHPETTDEVQRVVRIANRHALVLHPYSTGKNVGLGERVPAKDGCLLVDLGRMNRIVHVDEVLGHVDLEPGVTQGQLCDHLIELGIPFYADTTGTGRSSSVVGNSMEGGFGTTPRGHKRKEITCLQGIYGNGEPFDTGHFPGSLGPDLAGLFVQSNFGIVTQLRMPLERATEDYRSVMINLKDEADLGALVDVVRELRQQGTFTTQVMLFNALDALGYSGVEVPEAYAGRTLRNGDARAILFGALGLCGSAAAVTALYGSKAEVRAKYRTVKRAVRARLGRRASVLHVKTRVIAFLSRLVALGPLQKVATLRRLGTFLDSVRSVHGMMRGMASDHAMIALLGKVRESYGDVGLMWHASYVPARSEQVVRFVDVARRCYEQYGFEYPMELLLATPTAVLAPQRIEWRVEDDEEERRARALYASLCAELPRAGFHPYRLGVQDQESVTHPDGRAATLRGLKELFDPNGVLSPSRYGIHASP